MALSVRTIRFTSWAEEGCGIAAVASKPTVPIKEKNRARMLHPLTLTANKGAQKSGENLPTVRTENPRSVTFAIHFIHPIKCERVGRGNAFILLV
jgi:hypothetical protein